MVQIQSAMEIFKLLEKSNCQKCNERTCLSFAAAVFKGKRQISECPRLDQATIARYSDAVERPNSIDKTTDEKIARLKGEIPAVDLSEAANRLGGVIQNGKLSLKILGKDLSMDRSGAFFTELHVHAWLALPVLQYILHGQGLEPSGDWVPLRELPGGSDWYRLFAQRCEIPLKKVADTYTDLIEDMIYLFSGRQMDRHLESDISMVLHPLPKLPILICYWKPEDGLQSDMHLFFDDTAEANLGIEAIYTLCTGLVIMFEKIARRHG